MQGADLIRTRFHLEAVPVFLGHGLPADADENAFGMACFREQILDRPLALAVAVTGDEDEDAGWAHGGQIVEAELIGRFFVRQQERLGRHWRTDGHGPLDAAQILVDAAMFLQPFGHAGNIGRQVLQQAAKNPFAIGDGVGVRRPLAWSRYRQSGSRSSSPSHF